jgi:imidazolonepropionase-like amidohydrolase
VCGQAALVKTSNDDNRVVKELAAICFNAQGGSPRMSQIWSIRETIQRAKDYLQRRSRYEQDRKNWERDAKEAEAQKKTVPAEPAEVAKDEDQEPFAPLLRKEIPAFVHANRSHEINTALTVFRDEADLNVVLLDVADGYRAAEAIQKRNAPAALGPNVTRMDHGKRVNTADSLARAGVRVMFQSSATSGSELLRMNAAYAVKYGMDPAEALRALTINPARALNVQSRLGSIEPGKDADLVILSGDPFDFTTRVQRVLVNGKEAYRAK